MGTLIGYLITRRILKERLNPPLHLFFTGCVGPSEVFRSSKTYQLPQKEFILKLKEMGGSPPEILENDEFMELYEPILRADFQAAESYEHVADLPFDVPISVAFGTGDHFTSEETQSWQLETTRPLEVSHFSGSHFFILEHREKIIELMLSKLN
jgi:surfactin synthase thioesterase subunit